MPAPLKDGQRGFWQNLIAGDHGEESQLHRLQMLGFTAVLLLVFIMSALTLLAMMGVSGGTYLGFKLDATKLDATKSKP